MKEKYSNNRFTYQGSAVGFKCDEIILPNRHRAVREYLTHPGAVAIIPFLDSPKSTPLHRCRILLVEQYRYPVNRITEELPAGKLDRNESVQNCLQRELKEETGYSSKKFHLITSYWPTPAFSNEKIFIYWTDSMKKGKQSLDDDEFLRVKVVSFQNVLNKIKRGKIRDSKTVVGILAVQTYLNRSN